MTADRGANGGRTTRGRAILKRFAVVLGTLFFQIIIILAAAGAWNWPLVWIYLAFNCILLGINGVLLGRYNPEVIVERSRMRRDAATWDKWLSLLYGIFGMLLIPLAIGLSRRFAWPGETSLPATFGGFTLLALGNMLAVWAMIANKFFALQVAIQRERNHTVAVGGPYAIIRHPGYGGFILSALASPLIFQAWWAFLPAGFTILVIIVRTALEDRQLLRDLDGYSDYSRNTRFRLLPGIW